MQLLSCTLVYLRLQNSSSNSSQVDPVARCLTYTSDTTNAPLRNPLAIIRPSSLPLEPFDLLPYRWDGRTQSPYSTTMLHTSCDLRSLTLLCPTSTTSPLKALDHAINVMTGRTKLSSRTQIFDILSGNTFKALIALYNE